jgi:pimeloyl-ACP methyl ester carboxylesterase
VVGHSSGGLIALQLAVDAPGLAHSLALLEAPSPMLPNGKQSLGRLLLPMLNEYHAGNKRQAVEIFSNYVSGPDSQSIIERALSGSYEQAIIDIDAFIKELPAIQEWTFVPQQTAMIQQPVLSVLGLYSNSFMREGRDLLHSWFPQIEDCDVPTSHFLQLQDPKGVAHGLAEFFGYHPIA